MRLKPCAWFTSGATSSQCASGASGQPTRNLTPSQGAVGLISLKSVNGMVREMALNRPLTRSGLMSQSGQKRQFGDILITSGFPLKADIRRVA